MRPTLRLLIPLPLLVACGGDGGKGNDDTGFAGQPPDMASRYNVILGGTSGCDGEETWITGWAEGPLAVDGDASLLTFDFGNDISFTGSVSSSWQFGFSGEIVYNEAELEVYGAGTVSEETDDEGDRQLFLTGTIEAEVDDDEFETNNCTIEGQFQAYELTGI